jgi:hypothetical protein
MGSGSRRSDETYTEEIGYRQRRVHVSVENSTALLPACPSLALSGFTPMTIPASKFSGSYPYGTDYEWCAIGAVEQVAVFTTAGIGPMPVALLGDLPLTDAFMDAVRHLPMRGRATMLVSLPRPDDFIHFASRGFFAYDWEDFHRTRGRSGCYEMLSRPETPIHLSDLPDQFHPLLRGTLLPGVRFADSLMIDVRRLLLCEPAAQPAP